MSDTHSRLPAIVRIGEPGPECIHFPGHARPVKVREGTTVTIPFTHDDELDRLLWACREWLDGWQPDPFITDRRDRELYQAIKAIYPRIDTLRDILRRDMQPEVER